VRRSRQFACAGRRALGCDTSRRARDERRHRKDEPPARLAGLARKCSRASTEVAQRAREPARHRRLDSRKRTAHELGERASRPDSVARH